MLKLLGHSHPASSWEKEARMAIYYCHMFRQEEEVLTWKVPVSAAGCTARFSSTSNEALERRGFNCFGESFRKVRNRIQVCCECLFQRHDTKSDTKSKLLKMDMTLLAKFRDQVCTTKIPPGFGPFLLPLLHAEVSTASDSCQRAGHSASHRWTFWGIGRDRGLGAFSPTASWSPLWSGTDAETEWGAPQDFFFLGGEESDEGKEFC